MSKIIFTNSGHILEKYQDFTLDKEDIHISINPHNQYQKHLGIGGALTDAACVSFNFLNDEDKIRYLKAYFSKEGLNYNIIRYPLGSCDFSPYSYSYLNDGNIDNLSIKCDEQRIKMYKQIKQYQNDLIVFVSPWSPPSFMKSSGDMCHGGYLKEEYYDLYSHYLLKSVDLLKKEGIDIKVLNIQNEPLATQVWESCIYSGKQEANFIKNYILKNINDYDLKDLSIGIWDHNRDVLINRIKETFSDDLKPEDVNYICYHWYSNQDFEQLDYIYHNYPHINLIMSEGCVELLLDKENPTGSFIHAERYIHQMINDFNHYSQGYIDWNLSLDNIGGPNHVGNYCEAPIMIDKDGKMKFMYSYYAIAHFAKYIEVGAYRIESSSDNKDIELVAYINPDKSLVIVLYNMSNNTHIINNPFNEDKNIRLLPHSIYTIIE